MTFIDHPLGRTCMIAGVPYPTTIVRARYGGLYEGAEWLAFPLDAHLVPDEWDGDDVSCSTFFATHRLSPIGRGKHPTEALEDLVRRLGERAWSVPDKP